AVPVPVGRQRRKFLKRLFCSRCDRHGSACSGLEAAALIRSYAADPTTSSVIINQGKGACEASHAHVVATGTPAPRACAASAFFCSRRWTSPYVHLLGQSRLQMPLLSTPDVPCRQRDARGPQAGGWFSTRWAA